jgi:hypothetical protein
MIEVAILKNFDSGTYKAGVQLAGSLTTYFDDINVAKNIPTTAMVTGNYVILAIPGGNPKDAVIIATWPQGTPGGGGGMEIHGNEYHDPDFEQQGLAATLIETHRTAAEHTQPQPSNFLKLSDTPSSYSGQAGKYPKVNVAETGLEFTDDVIKNSLLTTQGDIIVRGASAPQRLAIGTKRFFLRANSNATALEYVRAFPFGVQGENGVDFTPWTTAVSGSGYIQSKTFAQFRPHTGTTASSTARGRGFDFGWLYWAGFRIVWQITFYHRAGSANARRWFKIDADTAADPTGAAIGFRIDGNAVKGIVHNGTSLTVVDLATTLTDGVDYTFRIEFHGASVYWYIGSVLKGQSSNVPSGVREVNHYLAIAVANQGDAVDNWLDINWHTWVREI